jgi:hypothetical protein
MSLNPFANKPHSISLTNSILETVDPVTGKNIGGLINIFLSDPSKTTYDPLVAAVFPVIAALSEAPRFLLTIDDGSVAIDTSKSVSVHVWDNFNNKIKISATGSTGGINFTAGSAGGNSINENHHTRPEMLQALLSKDGNGFSKRYSSSIKSKLVYYAVRIGQTLEDADGIVRISIPQYI